MVALRRWRATARAWIWKDLTGYETGLWQFVADRRSAGEPEAVWRADAKFAVTGRGRSCWKADRGGRDHEKRRSY